MRIACNFSSTYLFSAAKVPYNIIVKAFNLAGYGKEQQLYCFTQEGGTSQYTCTSQYVVVQQQAFDPLYTHTHTHTHTL